MKNSSALSRVLPVLLLATAVVGCANAKPHTFSRNGVDIYITFSETDVADCERLGSVGASPPYLMPDSHFEQMHEQAARMGADTLLTEKSGIGNVDGTAYLCAGAATEVAEAESDAVAPVEEGEAPSATSPGVRNLTDQRVAVLEFSTKAQVKADALALMSDQVREAAAEALASKGAVIMTRESMAAVIAEMGDCSMEEGSCEVETGRNIGADLLVTGSLTEVEGQYFVSLKFFDVEKGALLASRTVEGQDLRSLLSQLKSTSRDLFSKL